MSSSFFGGALLDLGEAIGSEKGGHFEDAMIVVALRELGSSGIVNDERYVGMELQGGSGNGASNRPFDGLGDGSRFGFAGSEQKNFAGFEDSADAHGDGAARAFLTTREEFRVVVDGFLAQNLQACAGTNAGGRLIETDMAVAADTKELKVDSPGIADGLFVGRAVLIVIAANAPVGDVDVVRIDIDVSKEIFVHEMMKALAVRGGNPQVLVEIESHHAGEIQ